MKVETHNTQRKAITVTPINGITPMTVITSIDIIEANGISSESHNDS